MVTTSVGAKGVGLRNGDNAFLRDAPNLATDITAELRRSKRWSPEIPWAALGLPPLPELAEFTRIHERGAASKFQLPNRLIGELGDGPYEHLLVPDDEVEFGYGFMDFGLQTGATRGL